MVSFVIIITVPLVSGPTYRMVMLMYITLVIGAVANVPMTVMQQTTKIQSRESTYSQEVTYPVASSTFSPSGIKDSSIGFTPSPREMSSPAYRVPPSNYICPRGCICATIDSHPDSQIQVVCTVETVSIYTNFEVIPGPRTIWLTIFCLSTKPAKISVDSLSHLTQLKDLKLLGCAFSELPSGVLAHQQQLEHFSIITPAQLHIPNGLFKSNVLLKELTMEAGGGLRGSTQEIYMLEHLSYLELMGNFLDIAIDTVKRTPSFPRLTFFDLSYNNIVELDKPFAQFCCPEIQTVNISHNALSHLSSKVFEGLFSLKVLELSNNFLHSLTLEDMYVLHLNLSNNSLSEINVNLSAPSLRTLDVSYNMLTTDYVDHLTFRTIEVLNLAHNNITSLSNKFLSELSLLTELDVSGNNLSTLLANTFTNQRHLSTLNLSDCRLINVDIDAFNGLLVLNVLDLSRNEISNAWRLFAPTARLHKLHLASNRLASIPSDMNMPHLELLDLCHNGITRIVPKAFIGMPGLLVLLLCGNRIEYLQNKGFYSLPSLQLLNLEHNGIKQIEFLAFDGLPSVAVINLNHNAIYTITLSLVLPQMSLQEILLKHNSFKSIEKGLFPPSVKIIDLAENDIAWIEPGSFKGMPQLQSVNLTENKLYTISEGALETDYRAKRTDFYLRLNYISCTCNMTYLTRVNLHNILNKGFIADMDLIFCKLYNGTTRFVVDVSADEFLCEIDVGCEPFHCECCHANMKNYCACRQRCPRNCTCIVNQSYSLSIVNCSYTRYQQIPQEMPHSATTLDFTGNHFVQLETEDFISLVDVEILLLNENQLLSIAPGTFQNQALLQYLDLSNNQLAQLNSSSLEGLWNLSRLNLSANLLSHMDNGTLSDLRKLQSVDLRSNLFEEIDLSSIFGGVRPAAIWMYGNPWRCLCQDKHVKEQLLAWAELVRDITSLTCAVADPRLISTNTTQESSLSVVQADFTNCQNGTIGRHIVNQLSKEALSGLISGGVLFIVILIVASLLIRYRRLLQIWLYARSGIRLCSRNHDNVFKRYDAYIAFSDNDTQFVLTELIPRLEEHLSKKLCIRVRDWPVGDSTADVTVESIHNSHRTILLLSDHFQESEWSDYEFQVSHHRHLQDKAHNHLIVFLIQDKPPQIIDKTLQMYITTGSYIKLSDKWCWQKLAFALPNVPVEVATRRRNEPTAIEQAHEVQHMEMERLNYRFHEGSLVVG